MDIHDGFLIDKVIEFCDDIEKDKRYECYNAEDTFLKHPLDRDIKGQLKKMQLKLRKIDRDIRELPYESCKDMDILWNDLIEKSIMCLRYFDKREPFADNQKEPFVYGLDDIKDYHEKYIDFEGVLYGSDSYYRDHVFHVIRVWLLGIYLLMSKNAILTKDNIPLIEIIHFEGEELTEVGSEAKRILLMRKNLKKGLLHIIKKPR